MRRLAPPVTEREILEFERCAREKIVGELELRVRRRLGVAYTQHDRRRDRRRLVAVRERLRECQEEIARMDARGFLGVAGVRVVRRRDGLLRFEHPEAGILGVAGDDTLVGVAEEMGWRRAA